MAATMSSFPSEPTLNLNAASMRAPYSSSAAPSMADTLPSLNFGFDELRAVMSNFTKRFDDFIETGRKRVLDERNRFRMSVTQADEDLHQTDRNIAVLESKTTQHQGALAAQATETAEMHSAIASLTEQRDAHAANVAALRARLASAKSVVATKRAAQRQHAAYMAHQASFNAGEIEAWEAHLGMRLEATGRDDVVRFVFVGIDSAKADRECWFEMDMTGQSGGRAFEVTVCRPQVDRKAMEKCLLTLCEDERLGVFLKEMRSLFIREVN